MPLEGRLHAIACATACALCALQIFFKRPIRDDRDLLDGQDLEGAARIFLSEESVQSSLWKAASPPVSESVSSAETFEASKKEAIMGPSA